MTKTPNQPATQTAIDRLRQQVKARRPWQLLMVSMGAENKATVSAETTHALTRLFEYLPGLPGVTLQTAHGDLHVSRDFPSGEMQIIDSLIASVFQNDPHVTGIAFPATNGKAAHVATADKPHFLANDAQRSAAARHT
ncbi:hypothetical protein HNR26_004899 [Rhizobium rosettiformans]|uniref:Uncharacterized protein n=2 Tax=Rhizobium rosettiformans TaxID=1368430 RepID=A0A4S8PH07_9HYPH|nr:hypothetical protein [Rhizobium rosettiformans]MBB5278785.1 hypothetical protein [Rhizobium rosettiformans]THV28905.1 hypothetical protein FAA86_23875 [Rhizobium rosettiformans W3]